MARGVGCRGALRRPERVAWLGPSGPSCDCFGNGKEALITVIAEGVANGSNRIAVLHFTVSSN